MVKKPKKTKKKTPPKKATAKVVAKKPTNPKVKVVKKPKKVKTKRPAPLEVVCLLTGKKEILKGVRLKKQVARFRFDSPEEYAQNFICKEAQQLLRQGVTDVEIRQQYQCTNSTPITFNIVRHYVKKIKYARSFENKRKKKIVEEFDEQRKNGGIIVKYETIKYDFRKQEHVEAVTRGSCMRPDIYLNNGRACNSCSFYEFCICEIKKLSKNEKRTPVSQKVSKSAIRRGKSRISKKRRKG